MTRLFYDADADPDRLVGRPRGHHRIRQPGTCPLVEPARKRGRCARRPSRVIRHELKLIVDLMYQGGLNCMRHSVSDTAEYGDYVAGPRIVTEETKATMRELLTRIQDGTFARNWIQENRCGRAAFNRARLADIDHAIERVGLELRRMMPFIQPREVRPGQGGV